MLRTFQFLMQKQFKQLKTRNEGFTLIELLVAIVIAFLIITPVMGFMLNIMQTDKKEQAKAVSEQELQTAIDFISQDLQQAVYIYDNEGLTQDNSGTAGSSGIKDQIPKTGSLGCPSSATCTPVLVFWKRSFLSRDSNFPGSSKTVGKIMEDLQGQEEDIFVYSLVGYYLIEGGNTGTWSNVARIGRFEIRDGIRNQKGEYVADAKPSNNFNPPPLDKQGNLKTKMNQWKRNTSPGGDYNIDVLVDYIDISNSQAPQIVQCDENNTNLELREQRVPADNKPANDNDKKKYRSFVACVNSNRGIAKVYIRGNALVRVQNDSTYREARAAFFPTVSTQIKSRGFLFSK
jgi:type II secretory pathway pseudopilin PulG